MTSHAKDSKAKASVELVEAPDIKKDQPGEVDEIYVDPLLFERMLRREAEMLLAVVVQANGNVAWESAQLKRTQQIAQTDAAVKEAERAKQNIVGEVESRYSISMRDWVYRLETGTLVKAPKA